MRIAVSCLLALGLAACAGDAVPMQPVTVRGDSYCEIAEKWRWHIKDTRETISQARRVNAKYDRVCSHFRSY